MDLTMATIQQLYDIAKDDSARMRDRYAARELQERKMRKQV